MKKFTILLLFFAGITVLPAQSPRNLTSNVTGGLEASTAYTVAQIESTFNSGRRQEETQLGLTANSIKNLDLPDQAIWDAYSHDQKMLFIMNDERTSRAGIDYGDGAVKGLPYQGVESTMDGVSQTYAELLIANNAFNHTSNGSPGSRISNALGASCVAFNAYSENLAVAASSGPNPFPSTIEASIFGWNYQDANSAWGHREASLAQTLTDDNGDSGQEGYIGVGVATGDSYTLFGSNFPYASLVVFNFFDPVATATASVNNCTFNVTVSTNSLSGNSCQAAVTATSANGNADLSAINTITTSGTVNVTGTVAYKAGTSITLNTGFHAQAGSNFTASIEACAAFTGNNTPTALASARSGSTRFTTIVQEHHNFLESAISPNPFTQSFMIDYHLPKSSTVNIDVFNLNGQKVMGSIVLSNQVEGNNQVVINGENWVSGLYLVRIRMDNQVWTKRLVKH
ncbi:MAG: 3-coathanger stack domain-containing protein [Saprospiraceae bacterium]